jgi:CRISPR/Cas system CMR subunit Cmr4 (Cas7 group RAMP superfamily)
MTPVREQVVVYRNEGTPSIETQEIVVPASSVKGAIAHRTAFYYNKIAGIYADTPNKPKSNEAVDTLFGSEEQKTRGHVLFSDVYLPDTADKLFNHVAIDRFTGGAMEGALFNEKATYLKDTSLTLNIYVDEKVLTNDAVRESFEAALDDLCTGYLPLGGCTNHGHGLFIGTKTVC